MKLGAGVMPILIMSLLVVLSVFLVVEGHRQGDANAISAATATAIAAKNAPAPTATISSAAAAASRALAKPGSAD